MVAFDPNIFFGLVLAGIFSGFGNAIGTRIANNMTIKKQNKVFENKPVLTDDMYERLSK